uniref:VWFC domain-containing protein n=2 Tax=Arion vulgaris TaxID=1028688 RepID=A0A0B6Z8M8_9EUPU
MLLPTFCLLISSWGSLDGASVSFSQRGCEFEGRIYLTGTKFSPTPCMSCHCPKDGGIVNCAVEDCMPDQHCLTFTNTTAECCPTCVQFGCRHTDGVIFQQGEVIRNEACVRCYCPLGGGNPVCDVTSCPMSQCVDPVNISGVCCPVCPNGPNCQIGLLTLPVDQSVIVDGATCSCESLVDLDGQKRSLARCNKD